MTTVPQILDSLRRTDASGADPAGAAMGMIRALVRPAGATLGLTDERRLARITAISDALAELYAEQDAADAAAPVPAVVAADLRRAAGEPMHVGDVYGALADAGEAEADARVEEDAATGREFEAEQQAEVDAALRRQLSGTNPAELAAVDLLIGAGWTAIPGLPTADGRVRWDRMRVADFSGWLTDPRDQAAVDFDMDEAEARCHDLAVSLATGEPVDMRAVVAVADYDQRLAGLILGAVRTALSPMPTGGAR